MGLGNFFDDVLGFDPNGGGIYGVARDVLGDTIADDWLGLDPNGGGMVGAINAAAPLVAAYFGSQFIPGLGGTEAMGPMTEAELGSSFAGDMAGAGYAGSAATAAESGFGQGAISPEVMAFAPDAVNMATNVPAATGALDAASYAPGLSAQTSANLGEGISTGMNSAQGFGATAPANGGLGFQTSAGGGTQMFSPTQPGGLGAAYPETGYLASTPGAADTGLGGMFQKGWNAINSPLWQGGPSARAGMSALQLGGNLYSMYAKNQMAKAQQNQANQVQNQINQINSMYAPGSPEYNRMMNEIARKDAAAGRNSQYGVRAQNLAGLIAQQKASMMPGITNLTSQTQALQSAANKDRYGALASLFANAGALNAPKAVDTTGGV